jgi:hypothetical protein
MFHDGMALIVLSDICLKPTISAGKVSLGCNCRYRGRGVSVEIIASLASLPVCSSTKEILIYSKIFHK